MSEKADEKNAGAAGGEQENGLTLDLNFAPSWARTDPGESLQRYRQEDFAGRGDPAVPPRGAGGRPGGRDRPPFRRSSGDAPRRDRPPFESRPRDSRPPRREPRFSGNGDAPRQDGRPHRREDRGRGNFRPRPERLPPLPLDIHILPEQRALGAVIKKIQASHRAFPLRDLANLFCSNPASCQIRIEPNKGETMPLFQCACCGAPALTEEELLQHLFSCHLQDYFEPVVTECEPPTGQFVCVARCGLSGILLGPPNHHSFTSKLHEVLRTRYPNMSEADYRARVEMVKDPDVIEQWRKECTTKTLFRAKKPAEPQPEATPASEEGAAPASESAGETAPLLEREAAESIFQREIAPTLVTSVRRALCPLPAALKTPNQRLRSALEHVVEYERRNRPVSILGALRGAFKSRKLHLFRANNEQGQEFVQLFRPVPLESGHAVKELCDIAAFIDAHPGCTKQELVQALAGADTEKAKQTLVQLSLLEAKGHVVHFFNDTLAAPCEHPFYQPKPQPKPVSAPAQETDAATGAQPPAATAEVPEAPAPAGEETDAVDPAPQTAATAEVPPAPAPSEPTPAQETDAAAGAQPPAATAEVTAESAPAVESGASPATDTDEPKDAE